MVAKVVNMAKVEEMVDLRLDPTGRKLAFHFALLLGAIVLIGMKYDL